ncbi:uracil-xanthine permease family protein [Hominiventricola filiformis]|uniref:Purine permease n=1 Tax=Hominiventricola filiformis TaxID=2885352 RepID=A0AAE3A773_9FIRM|nr:solute carrier family 23 protein [Hominiventricola filiformis]MBR9946863.1 purine permease [Clostridiaceae bacterium Marseille-Q4145]MCC2125170.1 purine permease [Hominiventricola filiformis]
MKKNSTPYDFEGRIPLSQAIPLGLQHVMAMFIGNLTPLIIVMGLCGLTADAGFGDLRTALLQNAMVMAGIVTLVQLFSIGPVGGKVPIVMGTSSGFLGVLNNTVAACGGGILAYGAIMGACIVGGIFEGVLGMFLKPLRKFFPAIVTGSVVIAIGLSLLGVGINYFCGGSGKADYGSLQNLFLGFVVLIVIILLKHFAPQDSVLSSAAILFGILAGYAVAVVMTLVLPTVGINADGAEYTYSWVVNFEQIKNAAWIAVPSFIGFGALSDLHVVFQANAIIPIGIMFIVTAIETVGDISACIEGGMAREATDTELSGGVICDGLGSSFAALFGVLPNTSFSQNVGLVSMTKVVNRFAISMGAIFLILCGFCPKIGAIMSVMPQSVLGGAAVMMFASILISGIQLITKEPIGSREITIISVAIGLGYGLGATNGATSQLPYYIQLVFGGSGIVPCSLAAILLNIVLPKNSKPVRKMWDIEDEE